MNGFLLIGYNQAVSEYVSATKLEQEISRKNINFQKSASVNRVFENIISYQLFNEKENIDDVDLNLSILVAGDIYGYLKSQNEKILNYHEAISLVQNSRLCEEYVAFEGNACFGKVTDEKLIFQNDLEGYRKLYYFQNKDVFCISTYLPLILAAVEEKWKLRKNAVLSYICSRESKWPLTFIEGIFVLPPLSRAELTQDGLKIASKTFSDFYSLKKISKQDLKEHLYKKYELIIKRVVGTTETEYNGGIEGLDVTYDLAEYEVNGKDITITITAGNSSNLSDVLAATTYNTSINITVKTPTTADLKDANSVNARVDKKVTTTSTAVAMTN